MPFDSEIPARSRDLIVLERARERIAQGWCQALRYTVNGPFCILAARGVFDEEQVIDYGSQEIRDFARLLGFPTAQHAYGWNDVLGRTQAEVLARFDAAIARLEKSDGE